jgi:hypothetical protein
MKCRDTAPSRFECPDIKKPDYRHCRLMLLRLHRERPRRNAPEPSDELTSFDHSIT